MIFLLDVHLPRALAAYLKGKGYDSMHVLDILDGARTKDVDIRKYADSQSMTLVSKDKDFVTSHAFLRSPKKLIKVNLGNVSNEELLNIFERNWLTFSGIADKTEYMIELDRVGVVLHEPRS